MVRVLIAAALVLLIAGPAAAATLEPEGSFGRFTDARAVAVDAAGRVYVADPMAGVVSVFDRARDGNTLLGEIGRGQLTAPTGVAIDNRGRVYVADGARDVIDVFEGAAAGFPLRATLGTSGTRPGQLDAPYAIAADPGQRLWAVERGNLRISVFRPAGSARTVFQHTFGIALPEPFARPGAIARDSIGRLYVAGADPGAGAVRVFSGRGRLKATLAASEWSAPHGVAIDRFDRLLVADPGGGRLDVLARMRDGAGRLAALTGLDEPVAVAVAPGALVYLLERGRVVRLRFDDTDRDDVPDAGDNCPGVPNGDQSDADRDALGDGCDLDDEGDGIPDAGDRCPLERRAIDTNGDGCRDTITRIARATARRVTGTTQTGELRIKRVEVAVGRQRADGPVLSPAEACTWLGSDGVMRAGSCAEPVWLPARGRARWRATLPVTLAPGSYVVVARGVQRRGGAAERRFALGRNVQRIRVR